MGDHYFIIIVSFTANIDNET